MIQWTYYKQLILEVVKSIKKILNPNSITPLTPEIEAKIPRHCDCGYPLPPKLRSLYEGLFYNGPVYEITTYVCPRCHRVIKY